MSLISAIKWRPPIDSRPSTVDLNRSHFGPLSYSAVRRPGYVTITSDPVSTWSKLSRFNHQKQSHNLVLWSMSKAYRIVFECPKGGHDINFQRKCSAASLSDDQAMKMFGDEQLSCTDPNCGWHGKASKTRLLRIMPFYWVLSPTT